METKPAHLIVGVFVLTLFSAMFVFTLWLARINLDTATTEYYIFFRGSVSGLKQGATVNYRGIPIGSVSRVQIDPDNVEQVEVLIEVDRGTPIKEDATAALETTGLTGLAYVQISGGSQASPQLVPKEGKKRAIIPSRASRLDAVFESAPEMLTRLTILIDRAIGLLDDSNQRAFADTLLNLSNFTGVLSDGSADLRVVLADAATAMSQLKQTTTALEGFTTDLRGQSTRLASQADATLNSARQALDGLRVDLSNTAGGLDRTLRTIDRAATGMEKLIEDNRVPMRDFSETTLYELSQFISDARGLIAGLSRVTEQLQRDPARFLFGDQTRGLEARP